MADVQPLTALHYDLATTGPLQELVAPPYDVIDPEQRERLAGQSPYNIIHVDLPEGRDPYETAAELFEHWQMQAALVRDREPALWALTQDFEGPDGRARTRHGFFARVRVEEYGPGRIRPHERTHPGPKEDRLRLTRATRANLSPIFALHSDPAGAAWDALAAAREHRPWGEAIDPGGTVNRVWRVTGEGAVSAVQEALREAELLIADGHHRYETARVYAEEVGGEGPHRYVLMCLVALEDPGLEVFPTHRLVSGLDGPRREALRAAIERDFHVTELDDPEELVPEGDGPVRFGYFDGHHRRPLMLELSDQGVADAALQGHAEPYRRLDTAVLEALLLKGALGLGDDDISHLRGLGYARDTAEARALVENGSYEAAFFMGATPVSRVREVAAAGESMPPKSTYFFPKVPTGLVFNPLWDT